MGKIEPEVSGFFLIFFLFFGGGPKSRTSIKHMFGRDERVQLKRGSTCERLAYKKGLQKVFIKDGRSRRRLFFSRVTDKSDERVGHLNTILARGGGNLNDPIFKSSNARALTGWGGGGGVLEFRVDRRITAVAHKGHILCINKIPFSHKA